MSDPTHWSRYWGSGQTHSVFGRDGPVDTSFLWSPLLADLPLNARILDLACGAGDLTAKLLASDRGFRVTGVDYAANLPTVPGATIHGGVRLESLPHPDGTFDACVSQFGFEYATRDAAAAEAVRVLSSGGRLLFLMHARGAPVVAAARSRLDRAEWLLASDGLTDISARVAEAMAAGVPTTALEERARALFREAMTRPQDETSGWALGFLNEILSKRLRFPPDYLRENTRTVVGELAGYRARLAAMVEASLDEQALADLEARLAALGLTDTGHAPVHLPNGDQLGWLLRATRP